jgi:hypothetical protein
LTGAGGTVVDVVVVGLAAVTRVVGTAEAGRVVTTPPTIAGRPWPEASPVPTNAAGTSRATATTTPLTNRKT